MSRRNFILLIIVLVVLLVVFAWIFSSRTPGPEGEEGGGFFSNLYPFGDSNRPAPPYATPSEETETPQTPISENEKLRLVKISSMPIAGYTVFQKEKTEKEFTPALRYVDRATGNIYQTFLDDIQERKFSITVVPRVHEAFFGQNGEVVIMRYLKNSRNIETFLANLPKEKLGEDTVNAYELKGYYLPENIPDLSMSPDLSKLFYLIPTEENVSGVTLNLKDGKKTQVFGSNFTEWLPSWGSVNTVTLTTKASGLAEGYAYSLDLNKKLFIKTLGGIMGLTALPSPDSKSILLSDSTLNLSVYDSGSGQLRSVGLRTNSEKCVWTKGGIMVYCAVPKNPEGVLYPDAWYQGEVSFNDEIWRIDSKEGTTTLIFDPATLSRGEEIDAIKLGLDQSESALLFVNKKDSFLWKFNLKN